MKKLLYALVLVIFGASTVTEVVKFAAASEPVAPSSVHWKWSGDGYYAREFGLTFMAAPDGVWFAMLEEWGKLESGDHWKELQQSYQMTHGSILQIGDRTFIVFAELQRAAEFTIAVDGVMQLRWFPIATSKPSDTELLSGPRSGRIPGLPKEMEPVWGPSPETGTPAPL